MTISQSRRFRNFHFQCGGLEDVDKEQQEVRAYEAQACPGPRSLTHPPTHISDCSLSQCLVQEVHLSTDAQAPLGMAAWRG